MASDVLNDLSILIQEMCENHRDIITANVVEFPSTWRHIWKFFPVPVCGVRAKTLEEKSKELLICDKRVEAVYMDSVFKESVSTFKTCYEVLDFSIIQEQLQNVISVIRAV